MRCSPPSTTILRFTLLLTVCTISQFWHSCAALAVDRNPEIGDVTTVAGNGKDVPGSADGKALNTPSSQPFGVSYGPDSALYVCEVGSHLVRRIDLSTGEAKTVAGTGKKGYSGDGGPATQAQLNEPYEVRFDTRGNMLFVEMQNHLVRKVDHKTGIISTIAGTGVAGFSGDGGPASQAQMNQPHSIALDDKDRLFICDIKNHRIRMVDPQTGIISTFAGTGEKTKTPDGASFDGTPLNGPRALDFDGKQSLYLALREGNAIFRMDLMNRTYHHLAGTGKSGYSGDGGPGKEAQLAGPKGVSLSKAGDLYFADTESHTVRVLRAKTGIVETVIGDGKPGDGPDGDARKCRLNRPHGVYVSSDGWLYVGDSNNHRVRRIKLSE
jgi:sugar lactone lactonase YvrE